MRLLLCCALVSLSLKSGFGQSVSTLMGARSAGVALASAVLSDEWAIWNNPAGLARIQNNAIGFTLIKTPGLTGSSRMAALAAFNFEFGSLGAGIFQFGDDLYNEQLLSLGYSNKLGIASLGIRLDYIQYRANGYPTKSAVGITFGGNAIISPQVSVGAFINNLNQAKIGEDQSLPTKLTIGAAFKPVDFLLLLAEVEKDLDFDPTIKGGIEYQFHKKVFGRTGFNLNPNSAFVGLGLHSWRLKIDYALQFSYSLNCSHQASVSFNLGKHGSWNEK